MRARFGLVLVAGCRIHFDVTEPVTVDQARAALAVGDNHACALHGDGIYCWGLNDELQLGQLAVPFATTPLRIASLPATPVKLAAGGAHTCFVSDSEEVYCWGANQQGQSGPRPQFVDTAEVTRVNGLPPGAIDVTAGNSHSCSAHRDGSVWCWGASGHGQAGQPSGTQLAPQQVAGVSDAVAVAGGGDASCALSVSGAVTCWGDNTYGQLGDGTLTSRAQPNPIGGLTATTVVLGAVHACALTDTGAFRCWGDNSSGALGNEQTAPELAPLPAKGTGLVSIAGGRQYTCAVDAAGGLACWGTGYEGQLGDDLIHDSSLTAVQVDTGGAVAAVAAGARTACAVRRDGEIVCWGFGAHGQVGDGRSAAFTPVQVPLVNVTAIAAGEHNTCAIHGGGMVSCWGDNRTNVAGATGGLAVSAAPVAIAAVWPGMVADIEVGGHHACVRTAGNEVWCWGDGSFGALGDGTLDITSKPRRAGVDTFRAIALQHQGVCAIRDNDGVAMCWGQNSSGELGDGTLVGADRPQPVVPQLVAVQLIAGAHHACVRNTPGEVLCWGANLRLETGNQVGTNEVVTPTGPLLGGVVNELRGGGGSTCAKNAANTVLCWGNNIEGVLDSAAPQSTLPVIVTRTRLGFLGESLGCDVLGECWGDNRLGQLGDGTMVSRPESAPAKLPGTPGGITVGYHHACAIVGGRAYCWGDNQFGQIGNGTPSNAYAPVTLTFP